MRVVAGEARGRRLDAPPGQAIRPTSDRVREAIFGVLTSLAPVVGWSLEGATVADLFAGSGALGIEALSRGAARAVFVDADRQAVEAIGANLSGTGLAGTRATVVRADVQRWLDRVTDAAFDLVLCDPPYAFAAWPALLRALVPMTAIAVLESGGALDLGPGWRVLKVKQYGGTVVTVARPAGSSISPDRDRRGDM